MAPSPVLPLLNVLVIEDDADMRTLICRTLVRNNVRSVIEASNGEVGWKLLQIPDNETNFVISDWNMPGISGIELLQKLKSAKPIMPVLMITGRDDLQSIKAAQAAKIDGYLVKPISSQELLLKIRSIVEGTHGSRSIAAALQNSGAA